MKILANDGIAPIGKEKLEEAGFEVVTEKVEQDHLATAINEHGYAALLVRSATKVRKELIDACPSLQLIGRGGVGMDNIDVEYARSKNIAVINTPAASSQSVAEQVFAHLFSTSRSLYDSNRNMPTKGAGEFKTLKKKYGKGVELRGKTLGIIGFGRIGQNVAKYALGCGMKVLAYDHHPKSQKIDLSIADQTVEVTIDTTSLETVLTQSDYITLHVPMTSDGAALIKKAEFEQMKDGVIIINTARGGIIDEEELMQQLDKQKVAHAALDVFLNEPTPNPSLLQHEKISLTPHTGAATVEAQGRIGEELASQIIEILDLNG